MIKNRIQILEYYDSLRNDIDIHCENLLFSSVLNDEQKSSINVTRSKFIEKIIKIQSINLENNQQELHSDSKSIFIEKFCFFIPRTNFNKCPSTFKNNSLGVLVLTNQQIDQKVIEDLKIDLNKDERVYEYKFYQSKECVIFNLLKCLIKSKPCDYIIDLSISNDNNLEKFEIDRNTTQEFIPNDFKIIGSMVNIKTCTENMFYFDKILKIQRGLFSELNWTENLGLELNDSAVLEPGCFERLQNLIILNIANFSNKQIDKTYFTDLINLKCLSLTLSCVESIKDNAFESMKSLSTLYLDSNKINQLTDLTLNGLDNLQTLELSSNRIRTISENAFLNLKNVTFLNLRDSMRKRIDLTCLNQMKDLVFLTLDHAKSIHFNLDVLDLPKLRYLVVSSNKVPKFKNVQSLVYLRICRLKNINEYSFVNLQHLKGLQVEIMSRAIKKINYKNFFHLKNLKSFMVELDSVSKYEVEMIKNKEEYYKKFLACADDARFGFFYASHEKFFEVSNYDKIYNFLQNELDLDEDSIEYIRDYHEYFN